MTIGAARYFSDDHRRGAMSQVENLARVRGNGKDVRSVFTQFATIHHRWSSRYRMLTGLGKLKLLNRRDEKSVAFFAHPWFGGFIRWRGWVPSSLFPRRTSKREECHGNNDENTRAIS